MTCRDLRIWIGSWFCITACFGQASFHGNPEHTGVYSGSGPRQFHSVKWRFATGGRIVSSPAYADGVIYFGSDDGKVYAVNAATGMQRWMFTTRGPVASSPAVAAGVVYIVSYDDHLYALDAASGELKWKFATAGERRFEAKGIHGMQPKTQTIPDPYDVYLSSPAVAQGTVYFGSSDGNVYAVDSREGELRWKFTTGDVVHASPAYAGGTIYIGSWDSYFYALDANNGKLKWRFHAGEDPEIHNQVGFQSSPAVVDGVVYTGCRDSMVYALDAATGTEKWKFSNAGSWVNSTPAVVNGKVIFATSDSSQLRILEAATGKSLIDKSTKAPVFGSPAVADGVIYLGVLNGIFEARDLNTGELLWSFRTEASRKNRNWALTADGKYNGAMLFTSSWRETPIVALTMEDGVGPFYSSPVIVDRTVYIGSGDGYLYAIE
ncbi:MAG TPA: PQQ-binding-like beta-propeller repeat protein [Bryobacteraceae bacterium]|nr:PQQ-binding-like beta-propeller repeat protein [Bryobacteraceae bacterium]